jgi:hypothetical protein
MQLDNFERGKRANGRKVKPTPAIKLTHEIALRLFELLHRRSRHCKNSDWKVRDQVAYQALEAQLGPAPDEWNRK